MSAEGKGPLEKFQRSVEAFLCIDLLDKLAEEEVITYKQIEEKLGLDVRKRRHIYNTAFRHLLKENGKRFAVEKKVGIRRLSPPQIIDHAQAGRGRANRILRRERKKLVLGIRDAAELEKADLERYNVQRSILEMLCAASNSKAEKKVEAITGETNRPLAVQRTLEALKEI